MTENEERELSQALATMNKLVTVRAEEECGTRPLNYRGPLPRPVCDCKTWGCWGCCNTEDEIRARQGIYS